jgi:hypothetical protein
MPKRNFKGELLSDIVKTALLSELLDSDEDEVESAFEEAIEEAEVILGHRYAASREWVSAFD